jgi:lysophospholipase L1-like esterase
MGAAAVTEVSNATGVFNTPINYTASWTEVADAAAVNGFYKKTIVSGDSAVYTFPIGTRSIWANMLINENNSGQSSNMQVLLDGVQQGDAQVYNYFDSPIYPAQLYRCLIPIARGVDPTVAHTVTLKNQTTFALMHNSFIYFTGAKGTPVAGTLICMGDSLTTGGGSTNAGQAYPAKLSWLLNYILKRNVTLTNKGVNGDYLIGTDGTHQGGTYRLMADVFANTPEFLCVMFGVNDLGTASQTGSAGQFARNLFNFLCFIEDALDTTPQAGLRVAVGTPPYRAPGMDMPRSPLTGTLAGRMYSQALDNYEVAVAAMRQTCALFPWVRVANCYEAADYRSYLTYPNNSSPTDLGNHHNNIGHGMLAQEFARALLGLGF